MAIEREHLAALARFAPIFTTPGFQFATWQASPPDEAGVMQIPFTVLSEEASAFVDAAFHYGWVQTNPDRSAWHGTGDARDLMSAPERISTASAEQIAELLSTLIRGERFCEGNLLSAYNRGLLTTITQRLATLLDEPAGP